MSRGRAKRRNSQRGSSALEFAFVAPVFLLMMLGGTEYARAVWTMQALQLTAQQVARCVAIGSSACSAPSTYALSKASDFGLTGLTSSGIAVVNAPPTVNNASACNPPGSNTFVQVTLTVPFSSPAAPLIGNINQNLVSTACYPITGS